MGVHMTSVLHRAGLRRLLPLALMLGGAALAGALLVRPRAALQLGIRAWSGWQVYRRMRPLVNSVLRQLG